jgi:peroxiredoxin (alkyl hydroperoxide reductase subunit C)
MPLINTPVPTFDLTAFHDGDFIQVTDKDLHDRWSVLFFYPADFTFVCPTELADLAEHHEELQAMGVGVYSVSTDTHFAHLAWHGSSASVAKISFPMIGDPSGGLAKSLGVLREGEGLADRATFVFDPDGLLQLLEITSEGVGRNATELVRRIRAAQHVREHPGEVCPARWSEGGTTLTPSASLVGQI